LGDSPQGRQDLRPGTVQVQQRRLTGEARMPTTRQLFVTLAVNGLDRSIEFVSTDAADRSASAG